MAISNRIEIIGIHGLGVSEFVKTDPPFLLEKFDDLVAGVDTFDDPFIWKVPEQVESRKLLDFPSFPTHLI